MTTQPHSPTRKFHLHDMEHGIICDADGYAVADCNAHKFTREQCQQHAALIVECVNAHDRLLRERAELVERLHWALVAMGHNGWENGTPEQREQFRNANNLLAKFGIETGIEPTKLGEAT